MYSVEEFLEQADEISDVDDDLERVVDQDDENKAHGDEAEETENKDDEQGSARKVTKKPRKPSNRPKLDVERLKGPRGLATMEKLFSKIQFQGNGHEQEDLQAIMKTLNYWCHRLFPKYSFDDCLEHLERLGSKKPVITLKKKILYDLFEEDQPIINDENDMNPETQEAINEFDLLLQQEPISTLSQRPVTPERIELTEEQKEMIERNRLVAAERRKARLEALQQKQSQNSQNENSSQNINSSELSEEQKAIVERNRQLALERLRAKNSSNISITSSMIPSSQDFNSTIDTDAKSQKSDQSTNFNELVDSFFPENNTDNNEVNSQKSTEEDVDINDLIEEMNPTEENEIVKSGQSTEKTGNLHVSNDNLDINLSENSTCNIDNTIITENQDSSISEINTIIEDKVTNIMEKKSDLDNQNDNINNSIDINSTKENTTANLLDIE